MAVCVCGRPIVKGAILAWTHTANPGVWHHYAKPARALTPRLGERKVSAVQQTADVPI